MKQWSRNTIWELSISNPDGRKFLAKEVFHSIIIRQAEHITLILKGEAKPMNSSRPIAISLWIDRVHDLILC